ncbi:MAG: hypothetical protein A2X80_13855 [Geobacteraceae bacterium GWB2_52_12]|nr:MAG: hypothetical protein A2X80_13855 [Geobacteraceae bacterium GWB2_52_12]
MTKLLVEDQADGGSVRYARSRARARQYQVLLLASDGVQEFAVVVVVCLLTVLKRVDVSTSISYWIVPPSGSVELKFKSIEHVPEHKVPLRVVSTGTVGGSEILKELLPETASPPGLPDRTR